MSDPAKNPYAQLAAEHQKRIDEIIRSHHTPNAMKRSAVELAKAVLEQCDVYEREFIRLLTERQGVRAPNFDELYRRKEQLDGGHDDPRP